MKKNIKEFLKQSNFIESEYGSEALDDSIKAWDYMIGEDNITVNRILEGHRILLENLNSRIAGKFRNCKVWVGGRECPADYAVQGLLLNWVKLHGRASKEEDIKKAHIAFEHIHPFEDGNGRIGRIIMNWQRIKNNLPILIIHEGYEQREYYLWFRD